MLILICFGLFLIIASTITVFGYASFVKPGRLLHQLATSTQPVEAARPGDLERGASSQGIGKLLTWLGQLLPSSPQETKFTASELMAAGFTEAYAVPVYLGCKILGCAVLLLLAVAFRARLTDSPIGRLAILFAAGGLGYLSPSFVLGRFIKRRQEQIRLALPDALDLLVISTEAGCALDKAMLNVSREFKTFHPAISQELTLVNMEMLAGSSRIEALRNFAKRTGEDEVKKLVAILVQTDRFGTSVAEALRVQSEFMRSKRRQDAEERAGKVGVKLVFPIFFFCMPALMILVAGPGMLQLFKNLIPALGGL